MTNLSNNRDIYFHPLTPRLHRLYASIVVLSLLNAKSLIVCGNAVATCGRYGGPGVSDVVAYCDWFCSCYCASGYYYTGSQSCNNICPINGFSGIGSTSCSYCPVGVSTSKAGSGSLTECTLCAPGWYGTVENPGTLSASGCLPCHIGYYSQVGSTMCTACPLGTTTSATVSSTIDDCKYCAKGYYGSTTSGGCIACPQGYSTVDVGSINASYCSICASGYGPVDGKCTQGASSSLPSCISGSTFLSSATGTCINCRSCTGTGMVSISSCSLSTDAICSCAGGYSHSQSGVSGSNLLCTLCPAGSWSSQGSTSCSLCPPGTYSLAGASSCTLCPAGTFGNTSGLKSSTCSGSCSACIHNGSINIPPALPAPLLCPAGSWAPVAATSCLFCPPGTYSLAGASSCLLCPEGTYGSTAGLTASLCSGTCIGCPPGSSFVSVTSLTSSIQSLMYDFLLSCRKTSY
jgi:hypothetical protein